MSLLPRALRQFFEERAPLAAGDRLLVAFSGGPDSTALLRGLVEVAAELAAELAAAHLDHGMDPGSRDRARRAAALAAALGVPLVGDRRPVESHRRPGESPEAAARRVRYAYLEEVRRRLGARYVATAHHRDDQVETLLLRLASGSGLVGLEGIPARRGRIVRPLLELSRREVRGSLAGSGLEPLADPTNDDLERPRNRLRHLTLPLLRAREPELEARVARLAATAAGVRRRLEEALENRLRLRGSRGGLAVRRGDLEAVPQTLQPYALALLGRRGGLPYPPRGPARRELDRQLRSGHRIGCDLGGGWRWESDGDWLRLARAELTPPFFSYTLTVPGELDIPEIGLRFRLRRAQVAPWMFRGSPRRAGLDLPLEAGDAVIVRNRRPGDRIQPLGCLYSRRLKDVLIDRHLPRRDRDRLALLCLDDRIAWVPGVAIAHPYRLGGRDGTAWIGEIEER